MRSSIRVRQACAGIALVGAVGLTAPAIAAAEPTPSADPLAQAVLQLENMPNADQDSLAAARAVLGAGVADVQGPLDGYNAIVELLRGVGIQAALWPSVAPLCDAESSLPLESAPAMAGAAPGPWPNLTLPFLGSFGLVDEGETLFAFVPVGLEPDGTNTSGMNLAWFNVSTFKGGLVPMGTLNQAIDTAFPPDGSLADQAKNALLRGTLGAVGSNGVRAVPVETGNGTVLSATFGTVQNGERTCFFLPTVGITEVE